jgi:hypothetical protein
VYERLLTYQILLKYSPATGPFKLDTEYFC